MATSTTRLGLRKPADTDVVSVTTDLANNYDAIDGALSGQVVSAFPGSPFIGKIVLRSDLSNQPYIWDGTAWRAIPVGRSDTSLPKQVRDATSISTTSTTYVVGSTLLSTTFNAPHSGSVYITLTAQVEGTSPSSGWASWELHLTNQAGAIVSGWAANDFQAVQMQDNFNVRASERTLVTGLTPITQLYYIQAMIRTSNSANACNVFDRKLLIEPVYGGAT